MRADSRSRRTVRRAAVSVRALACILVGHVEHHLKIFRERYGFAV